MSKSCWLRTRGASWRAPSARAPRVIWTVAPRAARPSPAPPIHWGAYRAELRETLERRTAPRSTAWTAVWRPAPALVAVGLLAGLVYVGLPGGGRGSLTGDRIPFENLILASRLDMIAKLDVVEQLDVVEDFDVIDHLDRLSTGEG